MLWFEAKSNGKWIAEWMKEKLEIKQKSDILTEIPYHYYYW